MAPSLEALGPSGRRRSEPRARPRVLPCSLRGLAILALLLSGCSASGVHEDGDGVLISNGSSEPYGHAMSEPAGHTRTFGGIPLCTSDGSSVVIGAIRPETLEGGLVVDAVVVREAYFYDPSREALEPLVTDNLTGMLAIEEYSAPDGFVVDIPCDEWPRTIEVAGQVTGVDARGGMLENILVDYEHRGVRKTLRVPYSMVACGPDAPGDMDWVCDD